MTAHDRTVNRGLVNGSGRPPNIDFFDSLTAEVKQRFWSRVDRSSGNCWLWLGPPAGSGYYQMYVGGRNVLTHRISFALANGRFDTALFVLHRCDTPRCVNPEHLFIGTQSDNLRDAGRKGRLGRGPGIPIDRIDLVVRLASDGVPVSHIAAQSGLHRATVYGILRRTGAKKGVA